MNKDWHLFFYIGQNFFSSSPLIETLLVFNSTKRRKQCWIFSRAETFLHTSSRHVEMEMVAMITRHVNFKLEVWLANRLFWSRLSNLITAPDWKPHHIMKLLHNVTIKTHHVRTALQDIIKGDLHGTILSHTTSLRQAYDMNCSV